MISPLVKMTTSFPFGHTPIITMKDTLDCGMNCSVLKLRSGEHFDVAHPLECAAVLLFGDADVVLNGKTFSIQRKSLFHEAPLTLHLAAHHQAKFVAKADTEFFVITTDNHQEFESMLFDEARMVENDHRGQGLLQDTAYRIVRTVFDKRNRAQSNLVVGEVVTFPGRWSSYPPHFHAQPEIYHYRFSEPQGFGYAELGNDVYKIHHGDTLKILDRNTHSQVSAPGYAMYYLWAIRHLPNDPYIVPTFVDEHAWTKEHDANDRVIKI